MTQECWITWEDHRRSRELSKSFGSKYICFTSKRSRFFRYPILSFLTVTYLVKSRPKLVFCQNPSIVLTSLLCFFKPLLSYTLIVDRHSNFKFHTLNSSNPKWLIFHWLSKVTLKYADLTIVTNDYLKSYINSFNGRAAVLPDKLPALEGTEKTTLKGLINYVFVATFSEDEPIEEMIAAASAVDKSKHIYITGNYRKYKNIARLQSTLPENVTLTGFISEEEYRSLLSSADVIIVITTQEHTLTCGAYEAVALEKPMILGNTNTIKNYFSSGALYASIKPDDLAAKINAAGESTARLQGEVKKLKALLEASWKLEFDAAKNTIRELVARM